MFRFLPSSVLLIACTAKSTDTSNSDGDTASENDTYADSELPSFDSGVSTIAGSGAFESIDGNGSSAAFSEPKSLVFHSDGYLIVADSGTGAIRQVTPDGQVTTLTSTGPMPSAPSGLAIDADGAIYISDYESHCIYRYANGSTVFAGTCELWFC